MTDTVVIGAGVVGMCCALFLQKQGCKVTVIDRLPPGEACSFGNAGSLSWSSCVPIATPGLLPKVPGWLLRSDGPLTIRWRYLRTLTPWLWQFIKAGNETKLKTSVPALAAPATRASCGSSRRARARARARRPAAAWTRSCSAGSCRRSRARASRATAARCS